MCDTFIATAEVTLDGISVFGKNSDREPNEAHHLVRIPAADHPQGSQVKCTYITIPQVNHTYTVLLAKPFWIWGAEIGANEHGVVIGNEAVFTKIPYRKEGGLIGMDFLRLALERASSAQSALTIITELLAEYGQGGNCGFQHPKYYHNSFIISDPKDAWLLETADEHWAARQVKGVYAISNALTIRNEWDLASPNLVSFAVQKGWCKGPGDFDFARCYSDFLYTRFSDSAKRRAHLTDLLTSQAGRITPATGMAALRAHEKEEKGTWNPDKGVTGASVCSHASFGPIRISQTTGSMVAHLHPVHPTYFLTGTAAPCTGIFKPYWLDNPLPDLGPEPTGTYDIATLFWRHESLHRATLRNYPAFIHIYRQERDTLEKELVSMALEMSHLLPSERAAYSAHCFSETNAAEARWLVKLDDSKKARRIKWLQAYAWDKFDRLAEMPV